MPLLIFLLRFCASIKLFFIYNCRFYGEIQFILLFCYAIYSSCSDLPCYGILEIVYVIIIDVSLMK